MTQIPSWLRSQDLERIEVKPSALLSICPAKDGDRAFARVWYKPSATHPIHRPPSQVADVIDLISTQYEYAISGTVFEIPRKAFDAAMAILRLHGSLTADVFLKIVEVADEDSGVD